MPRTCKTSAAVADLNKRIDNIRTTVLTSQHDTASFNTNGHTVSAHFVLSGNTSRADLRVNGVRMARAAIPAHVGVI